MRICNCVGYLQNGGRCCMDGYVQPTVTWPTTTPQYFPSQCPPHDFAPWPDEHYIFCRACGLVKTAVLDPGAE